MSYYWVGGSRAFAWERGGSLAREDGPAPVRSIDRSPSSRSRPSLESPPAPHATPYDSATKVNPPLRGWSDVRALWDGLVDGTVDAIATDHAPHASVRKDVEFDQAAFGISGLETALSLVLGGVKVGWSARDSVLRALTSGPARVLALPTRAADRAAMDA